MSAPRPGEISPRRAARLTGIHVRTIRAWCKAGRLQTVRIDLTGHFWILREEIEALMREAEHHAKDRAESYRRRKSG